MALSKIDSLRIQAFADNEPDEYDRQNTQLTIAFQSDAMLYYRNLQRQKMLLKMWWDFYGKSH